MSFARQAGRRHRANRDPWAPASVGWRRWAAWLCGAGLVAGAWVVLLVWGLAVHDDVAARTVRASQQSERMLTAMLEQQTALRGFAETKEQVFLVPFRAGQRQYGVAVAEALRSADTTPERRRLLAAQQVAARRWQSLALLDVARIERTGVRGDGLQGERSRQGLMDAFRGANRRYQAAVIRSGADMRRQAATRTLLVVVAFVAMLGLGGVAAMLYDVRRQRRGDGRLRSLIDNSPDLVTVVDTETRVLFQSQAVTRLLGRSPTEMRGRPMAAILHPDDAERVMTAFALAVSRPGVSDNPAVCRWLHADGTYRWIETSRNNLLDDPQVRGVVLNSRDVGDRRALSDALTHQASHDRLTGLPNSALLEDRLTHVLAARGRRTGTPALLLLDLMDLERVNESLGHTASDELLVRFAARLSASVRAADTTARIDGNAFAVLLDGVDSGEAAIEAAHRLLATLGAPLALGDRRICLHGAIGLAIAEPGEVAEDVLRNASLALAAARTRGRDAVELYRPLLHKQALERLDLQVELRDGLSRDELVVHYQPIFAAASGRLVGTEALVRWAHPTRGLLAPGQFLDLAEESGLIVAVGRHVLREACRQTAEWERRHGLRLQLAVNFSPLELERPATLVGEINAALADAGLEPSHLTAEITETAVVHDPEAAVEALSALRALGIRTAIDDFGTGHSSMSRLRSLPLDALKVPKPFVDAICDDPDAYAVAQGIVELGHRLRLEIVAEGIETAAQLDAVRAMGCELAQGFHLARPAAAADLEALLARADNRVA